ncbi:MAG: biotin--[acetyl-CoA-carboxylase] ligase [Sulfuricurvum sp.]|nr:biotin--[acetyl-CoA-carboxylase] ligase [Sulfuricurvum sp.]MDP3120872.1 biotin--[acetyl-CoA-carboxylase] ligase [Sulfuricurvum sp.]
MESESGVEIHWFDALESTQTYLIDALKTHALTAPVCIGAVSQTDGSGSRGNTWIGEEGNLFISVAIHRSQLPNDLKLESSSIYFAFIMKELLTVMGSQVWLKWPNDFYLDQQKVGGVITNLVGDCLVCGIGMNLFTAPLNFAKVDIEISAQELTNSYVTELKKFPAWKQIFSKFELEFNRSKSFTTHASETVFRLEDALLLEDGSLECNGQRIFSLR